MTKELTKAPAKPQNELMQSAMTADDVVAQVALVHDVMTKVMKKDEDYGVIPGGKKPSLWKPGSEKLCLTFRLSPTFSSVETYDGDHLTVKSICTLTHIPSGRVMGSGEAICSTKEKKYRLRKDGSGKVVPNNDLTDLWNTMLKMSNKRSLIAAVLIVTAASSMFTQDMGEDAEKPEDDDKPPKDKPIVETTATVKTVRQQPGAEPVVVPIEEPKPQQSGIWRGAVQKINAEELPGGRPCWTVVGADGSEFRTADKAFEESFDGIDPAGHYEIKWSLNKKGTRVLEGMKDAE